MTNQKPRQMLETPKGSRPIDGIMSFRAHPDKAGQTIIAFYSGRSAEEISYNLSPGEVHALLREREDAPRYIPVTESPNDGTCYIQIDNIEAYDRHGQITAIYYHVHEGNSCIRPCRERITPIHITETPEEIEELINQALAYRPEGKFVEPQDTADAFNVNSKGVVRKSQAGQMSAPGPAVRETLDI